jgi:hypothetical protein
MWYNSIMIWLLRSPLHGLLSGQMVLLTITGQKSGKTFTLPVNYVRSGEWLLTTSYQKRTWWRNLRGGARLSVHLAGKEYPAWGEALEAPTEVAENLLAIVQAAPTYGRLFNLPANPTTADTLPAAEGRVVIRTNLEKAARAL